MKCPKYRNTRITNIMSFMIRLCCFFIFTLTLFTQLPAQTYIRPQIGINSHALWFKPLPDISPSVWYDQSDSKSNRVDYGIGLLLRHHFTSKWGVNFGSMYYLGRNEYQISSTGINPLSNFNYSLLSLDLSTSLRVLPHLDIGAGISRTIQYDIVVESLNGGELNRDFPTRSNTLYPIFLSYDFGKIVLELSYAHSYSKAGNELLSLKLGYNFKVFDEIKNGECCPKF